MKIEFLKNSNVVSLGALRRKASFPAIGQVEAYWEGLRNGRLMPARAEVDPRGIADSLEFAFILERIAPGLAKLRLAGMHLNDLMGMEVRGMPITALFNAEARSEMREVMLRVMDSPAMVRLRLAEPGGLTRGALEGQMLLLPLKDHTGKVTRALGALQTRGAIGRAPRRFSIKDVETKPLSEAPQQKRPHEHPAIAGFAESRKFFEKPQSRSEKPSPQKTHKGAHLRLVVDHDLSDLPNP